MRKQDLNIKSLNVRDKVAIHTSYYQLASEKEFMPREKNDLDNNINSNLKSSYCVPDTV